MTLITITLENGCHMVGCVSQDQVYVEIVFIVKCKALLQYCKIKRQVNLEVSIKYCLNNARDCALKLCVNYIAAL